MKTIKTKICIFISISLLVLLGMVATVVQAQEFMQVKDVREGMTGYAKTVVHGHKIETFPVEILGVMKNSGPSGDLILARFSGPLIERTGGIAQGMSGSPVYIQGKLLGAIAYGWAFSNSRLGMITPITDMVKLWDTPTSEEIRPFNAREESLVPIATPLMVSGFDASSLDWMTQKLPQYHFLPVDAPTSEIDERTFTLEPGSAVAAAFVNGDMKMGAIGTVTYVDKDRVVAFGHPFLKKGSTHYFMHNAYIFTVVNNLNSSFKLGSIGAEIGNIDQDRGAGIAGVQHSLATGIPVEIRVDDEDTGVSLVKRVKIIEDNELTPVLASTAIYNTVNKALDRVGGGTVTLQYTIRSTTGETHTVSRHNMYYSSDNINEKSIDELYNVVDLLKHNEFVEYPVLDINMHMRISQAKKIARIVDATAAPAVVSPGDEVFLNITLHPYRGKDVHQIMSFTVPKDQPLGEMILEIRGGGVMPLPYLIERQKYNLTDEILARLRKYKSFADLKKKIEEEEANNDVVVEILETDVSMVPDHEKGPGKVKISGKDTPTKSEDLVKPNKHKLKDDNKKEAKSMAQTPYIVVGDGQISLQVVRPEERNAYLARHRQKKMAKAVMKEEVESTTEKSTSEKSEKGKKEDTSHQEKVIDVSNYR
ncbi:SpoIVB peptidase S55 [Veillonellaceae bacterium M2-8]|nr:SpoIVB peptidase S55 [Veillonellaceae bacterium M2-8]